MTGVVALHGGGEFLPGDERFLTALLEAAGAVRDRPVGDRAGVGRAGVGRPIRIAVVPTAAAGHRPDLAAANGVAAFGRVADGLGLAVEATEVRVVDAASAADPSLVDRLAAADIVYLPGGDPALIPRIFPGSPALAAIETSLARGGVLAGASAGAMALGPLTWTPDGVATGLAIVPGVAVMPHADAATWERALTRYGALLPPGLGLLGLAERTGVLIGAGAPWQVVGEGEVRWLAPGARAPLVARDGESIDPDAPSDTVVAPPSDVVVAPPSAAPAPDHGATPSDGD